MLYSQACLFSREHWQHYREPNYLETNKDSKNYGNDDDDECLEEQKRRRRELLLTKDKELRKFFQVLLEHGQ